MVPGEIGPRSRIGFKGDIALWEPSGKFCKDAFAVSRTIEKLQHQTVQRVKVNRAV